jgi:hypothetical protein
MQIDRSKTMARKTCYRCEKDKPEAQFVCSIEEPGYNKCRTCVSEIEALKATGSRFANTETHRGCYMCMRVLPVERFTRRSTGTYFSACKDCNKHVFGPRQRAKKAAAKVA